MSIHFSRTLPLIVNMLQAGFAVKIYNSLSGSRNIDFSVSDQVYLFTFFLFLFSRHLHIYLAIYNGNFLHLRRSVNDGVISVYLSVNDGVISVYLSECKIIFYFQKNDDIFKNGLYNKGPKGTVVNRTCASSWRLLEIMFPFHFIRTILFRKSWVSNILLLPTWFLGLDISYLF